MSTDEIDALGPAVRTLQIIVVALLMGVAFFGGYVLLGTSPPAQPLADQTMITLVALFVGVGSLCLRPVVTSIVVRGQVRRIADGTWQPSQRQGPAPTTDTGRLAAVYSTKTIISAAMCEGPCFLALFAYMTERQWLALLVAGLLAAGLLAHLPTYARVAGWVETQLRQVAESRQLQI